MSSNKLTALERMQVQMEYAVPLIRDLQRILGADTVNQALAQRIGDQVKAQDAPGSKADFSRMRAGAELFAEGDALDYEIIASDNDSFDMNVTRCGYTAMMEQLDARDIGHLLICNMDYPAAAGLGMDLTRTQTQMQGAAYCDFRYRRKA